MAIFNSYVSLPEGIEEFIVYNRGVLPHQEIPVYQRKRFHRFYGIHIGL
jgi:hypothetical protein